MPKVVAKALASASRITGQNQKSTLQILEFVGSILQIEWTASANEWTYTDIAIHARMSRGCEKGRWRRTAAVSILGWERLMLRLLLQPSRFSPTVVRVLYAVNDVVERSPLPWRLVCAEWRTHTTTGARMATRSRIHLDCNKLRGKLEFVLTLLPFG